MIAVFRAIGTSHFEEGLTEAFAQYLAYNRKYVLAPDTIDAGEEETPENYEHNDRSYVFTRADQGQNVSIVKPRTHG